MREYDFYFNYFSVDCSTDKPKQFRWNFPKKTKTASSTSSQNTVTNIKKTEETNSITEDGIRKLYELIEFLSKSDSNYFYTLLNSQQKY